MKFSFELHAFLVRFIHYVAVLLQLIDLDLVFTQLLSAHFLNFLDLVLKFIDYIIVVFLIDLFELCDFILQSDRSLQLLIVFLLQTTFNLSLVYLLFRKSVMQFAD